MSGHRQKVYPPCDDFWEMLECEPGQWAVLAWIGVAPHYVDHVCVFVRDGLGRDEAAKVYKQHYLRSPITLADQGSRDFAGR